MKKYVVAKSILFIFGFWFIANYIGGDYDCDKKCILTDVGKFLAIFFLISFILLFVENMREKVLKMWQIYVPAMFVLFSAIHYFDTAQHEQQLKIQKEYIDFKMQYASMEFKNINKSEIDKIMSIDLTEHNKAFDKYANLTINGYKDMVGRAMMSLTLGCLLIMLLDGLAMYFRQNENLDT